MKVIILYMYIVKMIKVTFLIGRENFLDAGQQLLLFDAFHGVGGGGRFY